MTISRLTNLVYMRLINLVYMPLINLVYMRLINFIDGLLLTCKTGCTFTGITSECIRTFSTVLTRIAFAYNDREDFENSEQHSKHNIQKIVFLKYIHSSMSCSQNLPLNPTGQLHTKPATRSTQVPLF